MHLRVCRVIDPSTCQNPARVLGGVLPLASQVTDLPYLLPISRTVYIQGLGGCFRAQQTPSVSPASHTRVAHSELPREVDGERVLPVYAGKVAVLIARWPRHTRGVMYTQVLALYNSLARQATKYQFGLVSRAQRALILLVLLSMDFAACVAFSAAYPGASSGENLARAVTVHCLTLSVLKVEDDGPDIGLC